MALIKCSECGKEVSSKARACPHCGAPIDDSDIQQIKADLKREKHFAGRNLSYRGGYELGEGIALIAPWIIFLGFSYPALMAILINIYGHEFNVPVGLQAVAVLAPIVIAIVLRKFLIILAIICVILGFAFPGWKKGFPSSTLPNEKPVGMTVKDCGRFKTEEINKHLWAKEFCQGSFIPVKSTN